MMSDPEDKPPPEIQSPQIRREHRPEDNLPLETRFKPGQSGNPGGRPIRKPFTDAIKRLGPMKPPKELIDKFRRFFPTVPDVEWTYYLIGAARRLATGKVEDFREAADRVEGKPTQAINLHATTSERDMTDDELKQRAAEMQRRIDELEHPN